MLFVAAHEFPYGPFRPSWRVAGLVVIGVRGDIAQSAQNDAVDPERNFATVNCRIAKRSLALLRLGMLLGFGAPRTTSLTGGAAARPDHLISDILSTKRQALLGDLGRTLTNDELSTAIYRNEA